PICGRLGSCRRRVSWTRTLWPGPGGCWVMTTPARLLQSATSPLTCARLASQMQPTSSRGKALRDHGYEPQDPWRMYIGRLPESLVWPDVLFACAYRC